MLIRKVLEGLYAKLTDYQTGRSYDRAIVTGAGLAASKF